MAQAGLAKEVKARPIIFGSESVRAILEGRKTQTRRVLKFPAHMAAEGSEWVKAIHGDGGGNWIPWSTDAPGYAEFTKQAYPNGEGIVCPYGRPGDHLWLREGWRWFGRIREPGMVEGGFEYRADGAHRKFTDFADPDEVWEEFRAAAVNEAYHWRPSIHMSRWMSRITLELTDVRVERLQDITCEDAKAEGVGSEVQGSYPTAAIGMPPEWYELPESKQWTLEWYPNRSARMVEWQTRNNFIAGWERLNAKRPGCSWGDNPWVFVLSFKKVNT